RDSVAFVKEFATIAGIDAVLAVVPYNKKPNQVGMYQHFKTIAEASELPIILYNVPGRTGACLEVETTLRFAQLEKIVAI
ncbi:dihydrodipicolinate synthase family protein, partial [Enterococcus faecalis]|uniref:dihydrodipicolinate synthase family protein n=1 Tax=Enterococcus faecalis TaxID=1351 RepID=UPI003CC5F747